jgi:hypothetical protein
LAKSGPDPRRTYPHQVGRARLDCEGFAH